MTPLYIWLDTKIVLKNQFAIKPLYNPALPCNALPCPTLPYPTLSCPAITMPCFALLRPALRCPSPPSLVLPRSAPPCPVLSCPVLTCPVLSCPVLLRPALSCHALPCFVANMASRLYFCNYLYLCIGKLQGSTGQIWASSDCGSQTRHWSSEILPYTSGSLYVLAASSVFKGTKNQFSTKEKIGKHGLPSILFISFFQAFKCWHKLIFVDSSCRGVISTFSWEPNFFYFSMPLDYWKIGKNSTLYVVIWRYS